MHLTPRRVARLSVALATAVAVVAALAVAPTGASANGTYLCTGYSGCNAAGYSDAGYGAHSSTSYWGMVAGHNCTNYAAYRLIQSHINASYLQGQGMAWQWGSVASSHGVLVDSHPRVGDIAWWNANSNGMGADGHVAYVEHVTASYVDVSEDDFGGDFHWNRLTPGGYYPTGFIHFGAGDQPNVVAAATNLDGRVEMFGVNTHAPDGSNNVFHAYQTTPGGSWQGWSPLPGYLTSIAVARNKDGRLEVFGANAHKPDGTNNVFHAWQATAGGTWSGWTSLLPTYLTSVAATTNLDGRLEVFGVNAHVPDGNNNVVHAWQASAGGSWQGFASMPGYFTSIAVARNKDGRLEAIGANSHLPDGTSNVSHTWQTTAGGAWSGWTNLLSGYLTSVGATTNLDGRLEVFGVNTHTPDGNNNTFHAWQVTAGGSWQSWAALPAYLTSIAAAPNKDGRLESFGVNAHLADGTNDVVHAWQQPGGGWSGWTMLLPGYLG
jgi:surface antigen